MRILQLIVLTLCSAVLVCCDPVAKAHNGQVRGKYEKSYENRTFASFYCIPYGEAPIGSLRFEPPQPAKSWCGIKNTTVAVSCPQYIGGNYVGQENCLCLNVFVPLTFPLNKPNKKLPVVLDIHSGAFMFGYGNSYTGPDYIMDRDVVFVTINYRLNALGFLSTEDDQIPGNMGMKDQVLALKWVQKNIKNFGGDSKDVTIMGLSAGGASVSYHYLSKSSKNLFKAGVSMSGSPLNPWALQDKALDRAKFLGEKLGCDTSTTTLLKQCLQQANLRNMIDHVHFEQHVFLDLPFSPYAPVVEKNCNGAFLCKHPYKILQDKEASKAPIIYAMTENEGLYPTAEFLNNNTYLPYIEANWNILCPALFDFDNTLLDSEKVLVCAQIKDYYLNGQPVSNDTFHDFTKAMTDRLFTLGIEDNAKLHAKFNDKVYVYRFNYWSVRQPSFVQFFSRAPRQGICHGDDVMMLFAQFHRGWPRFTMDPTDRHYQQVMWDLILSINTGTPITNLQPIMWTPMNNNGKLNYLSISNDAIEMRNTDSLSEKVFWYAIPFEENANIA